MSDWIEDVRSKYGHGPILVAGTGIVVWRKNSNNIVEILLQKRNDVEKYGLFGGAFDLAEHGATCAARELKEEANIEILEPEFTQMRTYVGPEHHTVYPNGDEVYHLVVLYSVMYDGDVELNYSSNETRSIKWFSITELKERLEDKPEDTFFQNNIPILWDVVYKFFSQ